MKRIRFFLAAALMAALVISGAGVTAQSEVTFLSTQFNIVEEAAKARTIFEGFKDGKANFVTSEEGPMIDLLKAEGQAGRGANDVIGALHGTFPNLVEGDLLLDMSDLLAEISSSVEVNESLVELGKLGTTDFQYYVPWMQATYTMAANVEALQYLPEGADLNALTYEQLAMWAKNMQEAMGKPGLAFPVKGLWNRFMQGYAFPSWTGGMVTGFKTPEAVAMLTFFRDELWQYVNPESINYDFMGARLLSGEAMVVWDHVARLKPAFDAEPDKFVAFPAPAGPAGRGYMPVVVGVGIPATAPNPQGAMSFVKYLLSPETQGAIMRELGFYPVVSGVDTSNLPTGVAKQFEAVQTQGLSADAIPSLLPVGLGARGGEINEIYRNAFSRVIFDGEDPEAVLNDLGVALQALLNETGARCWAPDPVSEGACQLK